MPRRSTRAAAVATGRANNTTKLIKKEPVKTHLQKNEVDDPPMDDKSESAASPAIEPVENRRQNRSDVDDEANYSKRTSNIIMKDAKSRVIAAVSNDNRRRLPSRRAASQQPAKYAEEDSTTGSSSDDDRDDDEEDGHEGNNEGGRSNAHNNKKRSKQLSEVSGTKKRQRVNTKAKNPGVAARKPLMEINSKNIKEVASGTGITVMSKNKWEPNTGGDWRDLSALDY
jgi:hypothetical protein